MHRVRHLHDARTVFDVCHGADALAHKTYILYRKDRNDKGALSSQTRKRLHGVRTLNHHFSVWSFDEDDGPKIDE